MGHLLGSVWRALACEPFTSFVHTLSIAAVTVHFLISLLFPADFSFISPQPSPFVHQILFSSHPQRKEERGGSECNTVWSVSVRTLSWGIPFLNHDSNPSKFWQHTASFISHFPAVLLASSTTSSSFSSLREYSSQGSNSLGNACFTKRT